MAWREFKQIEKEKRERNWNVNKPYRIVNQKVAKLAKRRAKRQFTHCHTASYYYYILYLYFYYILL